MVYVLLVLIGALLALLLVEVTTNRIMIVGSYPYSCYIGRDVVTLHSQRYDTFGLWFFFIAWRSKRQF